MVGFLIYPYIATSLNLFLHFRNAFDKYDSNVISIEKYGLPWICK
jgi:hypothetical protein